MSIDVLREALKPPADPYENGKRRSWDSIHKKIGIVLPSDYQQFIDAYGTGIIGGFIRIWNPFATNVNLNLIEMAEYTLETYRQIKSSYPNDIPYALHPDKGGLLPFGDTINGDTLFWLTESHNPNEWHILLHETRSTNYELYQYSIATFLVHLINRSLKQTILNESSFDSSKGFGVLK